MHPACGRVGRGAVTNATPDDGIAAIGSDITATDSTIRRNTGGSCCGDGRKSAGSGDRALLAIDGTVGVDGISSHIIGGRRLQARQCADEGTCAAAVIAV